VHRAATFTIDHHVLCVAEVGIACADAVGWVIGIRELGKDRSASLTCNIAAPCPFRAAFRALFFQVVDEADCADAGD